MAQGILAGLVFMWKKIIRRQFYSEFITAIPLCCVENKNGFCPIILAKLRI